MIPLAVPDLNGNEARYLADCVRSTFVSSVGPFVDQFEELVADASGAAGAVATSSGTAGLHLALTALGVGRGDLVILPSFTFIASANAIFHCGAEPWLIDISAETWTLDPDALRTALEQHTRHTDGELRHLETNRRVAAIMPVYTLGLPAEMDGIVAIAKSRDLPIVVDAAAALGASYRGRPSGDLGADLSVYSFNGNKTLTAGGGGAVVGNDAEFLARAKHLSTTARVGPGYHHDQAGFNYRLTNIQAAVGVAQLERLEELVAAKRRIRDRYVDAFRGQPNIRSFPAPKWAASACWLSGVYVEMAGRRLLSDIYRAFRDKAIDCRPFWKPIHLQPPYANVPGGPFPVSDEVWEGVVPLPCSTGLSESEQNTVIETLGALLERRAGSGDQVFGSAVNTAGGT